MGTRLFLTTAIAAAVCSAVAAPVVFDVGEGNVTNVTEAIPYGVTDVTVESGTVNLLNQLNGFSGNVTVNGGALGVQKLRVAPDISSLGVSGAVTLAGGTTFSYLGTGPGTTSAAFDFATESESETVTVDAQGDFTVLGAITSGSGKFVKTGPGTFTVGTTELPAGSSNWLSHAENGNSITVLEGGLAFNAGDSVTNVLGGSMETRKGKVFVGSAGHDAHLDIRSGVSWLAQRIDVGADGGTAALNVYGGTFRTVGDPQTLAIGAASDLSSVEDARYNVFGGYVNLLYTRIGASHCGSKGKMFVSGGTVDGYGIYFGHADGKANAVETDENRPEGELHVCSNGIVRVSNIQLARNGATRVKIKVTDGGTLRLNSRFGASMATDAQFILDGGIVEVNCSSTDYDILPPVVTTVVGERQSTVKFLLDKRYYIPCPIVSGVDGGVDGGLSFTGQSTFTFGVSPAYTGPTVLSSATVLNITNDLSLASLVAADGSVTLGYKVTDGSLPMLTLGALDVSDTVKIAPSSALSVGTYDIMSLPSDAEVDPLGFTITSAANSQRVKFSVRTSGGRKIVSMAVSTPTLLNAAWQNANGGAWETAGNWDVAPVSSPDARVTFATAASAQDSAVTLASPVTVGGMTLSSNPGYAISGAAVTLDNDGAPAVVSATAGKNTIASPVAIEGHAYFNSSSGATLNLSGAISGAGQITVNSETPGGTVELSGRSTVRTVANSGVASAIGAGSEIVIGKGTFEFAGGVGSTDRTVSFNAGDIYKSPGLAVAEGSTLTLTGPVLNQNGGVHKTGKGTLILSGAHEYLFGNNSGNYALKTTSSYLPSTDDAMYSFGSCVVGAGRMVLNGESGQSVLCKGDLVVGTMTTLAAGKETDAELEMRGGELRASRLFIGYDHGTAATAEHEVLTNRLVVSGGTLTVNQLFLGYSLNQNSSQHSELVVNGGLVNFTDSSRFGCHTDKAKKSTARVVVNGGELRLNKDSFIAANSYAAQTEVVVNGGLYNTAAGVRFSSQSNNGLPHRFVLNEGGTLRIDNAASVTAGALGVGSYMLFDGGVFQPQGNGSYLATDMPVQLGAKGVVFDTSHLSLCRSYRIGGQWTTQDGVAEDGGVTVQGSPGRAVQFVNATGYGFSGPVTVKNGGVLLAKTTALSTKTVSVQAGGAFGSCCSTAANAETTVDALSLADGSGIVVGCNGSYHGTVRATAALAQAGNVYVTFTPYADYGYAQLAAAGSYSVVRGPVGSLDATKFALSPDYPASASATFELVNGSGYDEVRVTLGADVVADLDDEHVWTAATGGAWGDAANWDVAPGDAQDDIIRFPSTLATPATIDLGGGERIVGGIVSEANGVVALTNGSLALLREVFNTYPVISSTCGTLVLPDIRRSAAGGNFTPHLEPRAGATQELAGVVSGGVARYFGNSTPGAGTIRITAPQTLMLETRSGTVEGSPECLGTAKYAIKNATLRFTSGGDSHARIEASDGWNLCADDDVYCFGHITGTGPFVKTGKGTVHLLSQTAAKIGDTQRVRSDSAGAPMAILANGDLPDSGLDTANIAAGKLVVGENGGTFTFNSTRIGCNITDFDENGDVLDSELEVRGGTVTFGDVSIARNCSEYRATRDSAKKRNATLSIYGGTVTMGTFYICGYDGGGRFNGNATYNQYGGTVKSTSYYIMLNAIRTSALTGNGYNHCYINIYGGSFTNTAWNADKEASNGGLSTSPIGNADLDINLYGGDFAWTAALVSNTGNSGTKVRFNFAGGRLTTRYMRRNNSNGTFTLFWNGGTYQPTLDGGSLLGENSNIGLAAGSAWTYNICSTNGANFEIPAGKTFTLDQALTHDADLGDELDGGIASVGAGTLVLGVANSFTGPVKAKAGTMRVDADGAIPSGVALELSGGTIDLNGHSATVGDVTGNGGWVRNGTVTVNGTVSVGGGVDSWVGMDAAVFGAGAMFVPHYSYNDSAHAWTGDFMKLGGSATGTLVVDLGRTAENPLPKGFCIKIAELPAAAAFPAVRVVNWGDEYKTTVRVFRMVNGDTAEIYVEVIGKGSVLTFR